VSQAEARRVAEASSRSASTPFRLSLPSLSKFSGSSDSLSLADWLLDAQLLTAATKLSPEESLLYAASSLTELAQQVWRKASTDFRSRNVPVTWSLFRDTLEQGLGVHNVEFDAREKLSSLVQKTTVRQFAAEFRRLHALIASEPVSGGEKVHKFLSGLRPELKKLCLVDPSRQNQI
jgi:hypothetical protein